MRKCVSSVKFNYNRTNESFHLKCVNKFKNSKKEYFVRILKQNHFTQCNETKTGCLLPISCDKNNI